MKQLRCLYSIILLRVLYPFLFFFVFLLLSSMLSLPVQASVVRTTPLLTFSFANLITGTVGITGTGNTLLNTPGTVSQSLIEFNLTVARALFVEHHGAVIVDISEVSSSDDPAVAQTPVPPTLLTILPTILPNLFLRQEVQELFLLETTRHFLTLPIAQAELTEQENSEQLALLLLIQNSHEAILLYNSVLYTEDTQFTNWSELPLLDIAAWPDYFLPLDGQSSGTQQGQIDRLMIERQFNLRFKVRCDAAITVDDFLTCAQTNPALQNTPWRADTGRLLFTQSAGDVLTYTLWLFGEFPFDPFTCNSTRMIQYTTSENRSVLASNCSNNIGKTTDLWPNLPGIPARCQACSCEGCSCWLGFFCARPR